MTSWIELQPLAGKSGLLVALEAAKEVPFPITRVYYVLSADPSAVLGRHAHRRGHQVLVCLAGSCTLTLDDGTAAQEFVLDRPDRGLLLRPLLWEEFRLSADAVLLVLCSTPYEADDQIEDRDEFLALVRGSAASPSVASPGVTSPSVASPGVAPPNVAPPSATSVDQAPADA